MIEVWGSGVFKEWNDSVFLVASNNSCYRKAESWKMIKGIPGRMSTMSKGIECLRNKLVCYRWSIGFEECIGWVKIELWSWQIKASMVRYLNFNVILSGGWLKGFELVSNMNRFVFSKKLFGNSVLATF